MFKQSGSLKIRRYVLNDLASSIPKTQVHRTSNFTKEIQTNIVGEMEMSVATSNCIDSFFQSE